MGKGGFADSKRGVGVRDSRSLRQRFLEGWGFFEWGLTSIDIFVFVRFWEIILIVNLKNSYINYHIDFGREVSSPLNLQARALFYQC